MPRLTCAGIIAAGEGSRLQAGRSAVIKPLAVLAGKPLCHWIVGSLQGAGITDFTLLHNSRGRAVEESLRGGFPDAHWTFLEADTASSWESFRLVAKTLARTASSFLISAVDSLMATAQALRFAQAMAAQSAQAGLALTDFIDDEKPLWAELDSGGRVTALGSACRERRLATAGLYFMTADAAERMPAADGFHRLRDYLGSLVESGRPVAGLALDKTLDVDRPQDLIEAEAFIKEAGPW